MAPESDLLPGLVDWLLDQRRGTSWGNTLDSALAVRALCELPLDDTPPRWSLSINGQAVLADAAGPATITTRLLHQGENDVVVRSPDGRKLRVAVEARVRGVEPAEGTILDDGLERRLERFVAGVGGGEGAWVGVPPGGSVSRRDRLRVRIAFHDVADRLLIESPLPAGLEPVWEAQDALGEEDRDPDPLWARREAHDDRVCLAAEWIASGEGAFEVRAGAPGRYRMAPARAFEMYDERRQWSTPAYDVVVEE